MNVLLLLIIVYLRVKYLTQRYKKKELVDKSDISGFIDNSNLDKKIATPAEKTELKSNQNKITKSEAFDSSYFRDESHYEDDGTQNYLLFQPVYS